MATLNICLWKNVTEAGSVCVGSITLRCKRSSERELRSYYGKDHDVEEMYYIRKPNEWGIKWVVLYKGRYDNYWTTAGTKSLPAHDFIRVHKL